MDRRKATAWFLGIPVVRREKGGPGSGNFGHRGIRGQRGGSLPGGGHGALGIAAGASREEILRTIEAKREAERTGVKTGASIRAELEVAAFRTQQEIQDLQRETAGLETRFKVISERQERLFERGFDAQKRGDDPAAQRAFRKLERLQEERTPLCRQLEQKNDAVRELENRQREQAAKIMSVSEPADFNVDMGRLRAGRDDVRQGQEAFSRLVGTGSLDGETVKIGRTKDRRAFYTVGSDTVSLATTSKARTVVHELGHWLEDRDPRIAREARRFLSRRTSGEKAQSLRALTGNRGYKANETAKPDRFTRPYMGKIYRGGETEIISMGLEQMFADPLNFARKDPEYFDFIYNIVSVNPRRFV